MSLKAKDLLIVILSVVIAGQFFLLFRATRVSTAVEKILDRVPYRIPTEVYVMDLTEAIERQNRAFVDLSYQNRWMRLHLDNCLSLIESERGLELIPVKYRRSVDKPDRMILFEMDRNGPFVRPYIKYTPSSEKSEPNEKSLHELLSLINATTLHDDIESLYLTDEIINNFQQRLERIAPRTKQYEVNKI